MMYNLWNETWHYGFKICWIANVHNAKHLIFFKCYLYKNMTEFWMGIYRIIFAAMNKEHWAQAIGKECKNKQIIISIKFYFLLPFHTFICTCVKCKREIQLHHIMHWRINHHSDLERNVGRFLSDHIHRAMSIKLMVCEREHKTLSGKPGMIHIFLVHDEKHAKSLWFIDSNRHMNLWIKQIISTENRIEIDKKVKWRDDNK